MRRHDAAWRPVERAGVRGASFAVLLGLAAVLAAQSADGREIRPVRSLVEIRQEGVVIQQWDLSCGAAALATILTYQHGDPVPEREVAQTLIRRKEYIENPLIVRVRQGFSFLDLKRYVEGRGYEGIGYGQLTLRDLVEYAPIMVPVNFTGYNHFVVFRGMRGDRVVFADPAFGNRTMRAEAFERAWLEYPEFGRVGFVVARREGTAVSANHLAPEADDFVLPPDALLRTALPFSARP